VSASRVQGGLACWCTVADALGQGAFGCDAGVVLLDGCLVALFKDRFTGRLGAWTTLRMKIP